MAHDPGSRPGHAHGGQTAPPQPPAWVTRGAPRAGGSGTKRQQRLRGERLASGGGPTEDSPVFPDFIISKRYKF